VTHAIETNGLQYRVGRSFEIAGLDLRVPTGAIYGFLGANGSGKTTTIRLLLGLLRPKAGSITVLGQPMPAHAPAILARVGYVPEAPHLDGTLTVGELLRFQAAFYPRWDRALADTLLGQFELDPQQLFGRQSKGQKAKTMMLLALAQRPELLVLDEPTDGLDPVARRDILTALLEFVAQGDATVFISTHLVHELERICDWIGVMDQGHLLVQEPLLQLKRGVKRLRIGGLPAGAMPPLPATLLQREIATAGTETWTVREWEAPMAGALTALGATVLAETDLDLEDGFIALLRAFRANPTR
jgi:ABC-2 type transport system ATP-binding protein